MYFIPWMRKAAEKCKGHVWANRSVNLIEVMFPVEKKQAMGVIHIKSGLKGHALKELYIMVNRESLWVNLKVLSRITV